MSIFKPKRFTRRELIEEALKDLNPSTREFARRVLEEIGDQTRLEQGRAEGCSKKRINRS